MDTVEVVALVEVKDRVEEEEGEVVVEDEGVSIINFIIHV